MAQRGTRWQKGTAGAAMLALTLASAAWWTASGDEIGAEGLRPASVEVSADRGAKVKPAVGAAIVVTLRWGRTDASVPTTADEAKTPPVVWDGFLSVDCGDIRQVSPLSFELDDPASPELRPYADFLGEARRGDRGDHRVYWRSKTRRGWDGVVVRLTACDPDPEVADGAGTTLAIRTEQRDYTARLDWSANDFVSLHTDRPDQKLEVYINAEYDERALAGARITALDTPAPGVW